MKNINVLLILIISIFLAACNEEEQICVKTDFIGEFVGSTVCSGITGTGPSVAAVINVRDGNAENEIIVNVDAFELAVLIEGCTFSGVDKNADVDVTFSGSLNGDKLTVKLEGIIFDFPVNCETEGERN